MDLQLLNEKYFNCMENCDYEQAEKIILYAIENCNDEVILQRLKVNYSYLKSVIGDMNGAMSLIQNELKKNKTFELYSLFLFLTNHFVIKNSFDLHKQFQDFFIPPPMRVLAITLHEVKAKKYPGRQPG